MLNYYYFEYLDLATCEMSSGIDCFEKQLTRRDKCYLEKIAWKNKLLYKTC